MIDSAQQSAESQNEFDSDSGSDSDSGGWITPSNLKKKQAADATGSMKEAEAPATMQVAVITTDFAMQNVILQMNLNLLSSTMFRVKRLNTYVLRCHACFNVCRDLSKQFCPRCGQATLTRVACSTSASGEFRLHLKKNMQWNHRGDRYSIPKPVHGSSNGKLKGGGKGGWGNELMLAEDQKEYENAKRLQQRQKTRNLMDEDYLPGILTGDRGKGGGRIKVGAGRNVNSKKR
jgi:RNA-binding protein NOB1